MVLWWIANAILLVVILPVVIALLNRVLAALERIRGATDQILAGGVTLIGELDGVPVRDVDGGEQSEPAQRVSSQLPSSTAPASPDFSGWNWVAASTPCSAAAANGSPCSAHVISAPAAASSCAPGDRSA